MHGLIFSVVVLIRFLRWNNACMLYVQVFGCFLPHTRDWHSQYNLKFWTSCETITSGRCTWDSECQFRFFSSASRDCSPRLLGLFILYSVNLSYILVVCGALVSTVDYVYNYVHIALWFTTWDINIVFDFVYHDFWKKKNMMETKIS
jgi:hypothetical protein